MSEYISLDVIRRQAKLIMRSHDRLPLDERLENYASNGFWEDYDATWNRTHRPARTRYTLTMAQLRRSRII